MKRYRHSPEQALRKVRQGGCLVNLKMFKVRWLHPQISVPAGTAPEISLLLQNAGDHEVHWAGGGLAAAGTLRSSRTGEEIRTPGFRSAVTLVRVIHSLAPGEVRSLWVGISVSPDDLARLEPGDYEVTVDRIEFGPPDQVEYPSPILISVLPSTHKT
jgi:hypothetical protein